MIVSTDKAVALDSSARSVAFARAPAIGGYIGLVRFPNHVTFSSVIAGALLSTQRVDAALFCSLALLYVCFNVLFYGGIYAANALTDLESDAAHPGKRRRPVPSGAVSRQSAAIFAAVMTIAGLVGGFVFFETRIFLVFLAILGVNALYSLAVRGIPYLEFLGNAAPHPLRFLMGVLLVGGSAPYLFLAAFLIFGVGASAVRRMVEKSLPGWEARRTLSSYTDRDFLVVRLACLAGILAVAAADFPKQWTYYVVLTAAYVIGVIGFERFTLLRRYYAWVWTR